jgi:hypothetical protein
MTTESELISLLRRSIVAKGKQRIADIEEALSIAMQLAGTSHSHKAPASAYRAAPSRQATNELTSAESLREILTWPEVKSNPAVVARLFRRLRELR